MKWVTLQDWLKQQKWLLTNYNFRKLTFERAVEKPLFFHALPEDFSGPFRRGAALLPVLVLHSFFMKPGGGEPRKQPHGGAEHDAFRRVHEAEKHGEDADGAADKETSKNKRTHTEPHGRAFHRRIKKEGSPS